MSIVDVKVTPVKIPLKQPKKFALRTVSEREYTIVEIVDADGMVGWGYTWGPRVISQIIQDMIRELLIGENPVQIEYLWEKMYRSTLVWGRRGLLLRAISAVDIALWDLLGRRTGQPLHHLLGGYRREVPAYYSGGYYLPQFEKTQDYLDYLEEEIVRMQEMGFIHFKMKVGAVPLDVDYQRVQLARKLLGNGKLMLDANCAYNCNEALRAIDAFADLAPEWFEEPLSPDDVQGYAKLSSKTTVPIAVGENHFTRWEFSQLLEADAVDIVQGDPIIMGGITEFRKLHGMISTGRARLAPHNSHNINVHVGAGMPYVEILEFFDLAGDVFNFDVLMKNPLKPSNGHLTPRDLPGHGLEIDRDALNHYHAGNHQMEG